MNTAILLLALLLPGAPASAPNERSPSLAEVAAWLEEAAHALPESFPVPFQIAPLDSEKPNSDVPSFVRALQRSKAAHELAPDLFPIWRHLQTAPPKETKRPPGTVRGCMKRAAVLIAEKKRDEAISLLLHAHALKPRDFPLALKIGELLQAPESLEAAQSFAETLVGRFPQKADAWRLLGAILLQRGRHEDALAPLRKAEQLNPKSAAIWFMEGSANAALQRWELSAIKLVQAVRLDPKNELYWRALTDGYRKSRDLLAGEMKIKQLIEAFPTSASAWYSLGCVHVAGGLRQDGLKAWQKAVELRPKYADAWSQIGVLQLQDGDRKSAMNSFQRALKAQPRHAEASNNRGWLLLAEDKLTPAIADFQTAIKSDPTYTRAMVNLIRAYVKNGDPARANGVCDQLASLDAAAGATMRKEIPR